MKKIFFGAVLAVAALLMSCEKQVIQKTAAKSTEVSSEKIDKPKYATVACETFDPEGNKGIGTRCRKVPGGNCKKATACSNLALSTGFVLPDGWTQEKFEAAWGTEEGAAYLEGLGYHQRDVE